MDIQHFVDRKREAGKREHEGNQSDWKGWGIDKYWAAIAGELLDAIAYCDRLADVANSKHDGYSRRGATDTSIDIKKALSCFNERHLEAACAEAEEYSNKYQVNCPHCDTEHPISDCLVDNTYVSEDANIITCSGCGKEFYILIHGNYEEAKYEVISAEGKCNDAD